GPTRQASISSPSPFSAKDLVEVVEDRGAALDALPIVAVRRGDPLDESRDPARFVPAVLAVLEVDVMNDLPDGGQRRVVQFGARQQHFERAAIALVRELAVEHVEAQL